MDLFLVILFMLLGVVFLLLELFVIPGISVGGFAGIAFVVASVWYAFVTLGSTAGCITLCCGIMALVVAIWLFMRSRTLDKMSLTTEIDAKVDAPKETLASVGDKGTTMSRLAPIGMARINGKSLEVKSACGFVDQNVEVEVVEVAESTILVKTI